MSTKRAVSDPEVIAEWSRRIERRHFPGLLDVAVSFAIILVAVLFVAYVEPNAQPRYGFPLLIAVFFGWGLWRRYSTSPRCPHCEKRIQRSNNLFRPNWARDFCPHCHYWLVEPSNPLRGD